MPLTPREVEVCEKCRTHRKVTDVLRKLKDDETAYAVAWICPQCQSKVVEVCPTGPVVPSTDSCLNCGREYGEQSDASGSPICPSCGLNKVDALTFLEIDPSHDPVAAGKELFTSGRIRSGIAHLNYKLLSEPTNSKAWDLKCWMFGELGFFNTILSALEKGFPNGIPHGLLFNKAFALQGLGKDAEAIEIYKEYLDRATPGVSHGICHSNLANSFTALGDYPNAERYHEMAVAEEPLETVIYRNFSRMLLNQHRWKDALSIIEDGLTHGRRDRHTPTLLADKAFALAEQGLGQASLKAAQEAVGLDGSSLRGTYLLGRALALVGRLEEARVQIGKVLALDPENADGLRAKAMLDQALGPQGGKRWWQIWK